MAQMNIIDSLRLLFIATNSNVPAEKAFLMIVSLISCWGENPFYQSFPDLCHSLLQLHDTESQLEKHFFKDCRIGVN